MGHKYILYLSDRYTYKLYYIMIIKLRWIAPNTNTNKTYIRNI